MRPSGDRVDVVPEARYPALSEAFTPCRPAASARLFPAAVRLAVLYVRVHFKNKELRPLARHKTDETRSGCTAARILVNQEMFSDDDEGLTEEQIGCGAISFSELWPR
jgi:hypothetical protein